MSSATPSGAPHATISCRLLPAQWWWLGVVLPTLVYATRAVYILADPRIPYDTLHTYLPLARAFLEDPSSYFTLPNSVTVAPGAVLYMAIWGADPVAIKAANLFIGLASLLLASDAVRRLAGPAAGAAAAWGFATSQMLVTTGVTLMGEAPFVFLVVLWLWACSWACDGAQLPRKNRVAAVVLGGVALTAATLTRATWLYWLPAASLAGLVMALLCKGDTRRVFLRLATIHLIALALVGSFMLHQREAFGRPLVATGSGAALYFGSNAVLHGYEPPFFGLAHDEFTVTDNLGHLSLEGDRRLLAVTRAALLDTAPAQLFHLYFQKLGAFLFFSRAQLSRHVFNDRAMRIGLLVLALGGLIAGRKKPLVWLLAGAAAYQCAVHIPVMYNPRYSASALDPPLTLLAAAGLGLMITAGKKRRFVALAGTLFVVMTGVAIGAWNQRHGETLMPDIASGPNRLIQQANKSELSVKGNSGNPFEKPVPITHTRLVVEWAPPSLQLSNLAVLNLPLRHFEGQCRELWIVYTTPTGAARSARVLLDGLRPNQNIAWGMDAVSLPNHKGILRLEFACSPGTVVEFGAPALYDVALGHFYRAQALGPELARSFPGKDAQ
ncbi:hypothetical protein [Simplicispira hankyongi]|uniref:hypothetical protein n=1 Tax=Simplicispira hankyongi TaxID=2315688 RepID=UPI0013158540|nr:hypothetical protein [Simplicispira hankyongi]